MGIRVILGVEKNVVSAIGFTKQIKNVEYLYSTIFPIRITEGKKILFLIIYNDRMHAVYFGCIFL